ncbi:MAG: PAS domain-containing protein, partial [Deltaproteobacteria bacterium]|nr:PAS domain-containing protein [Deltaproteobacteria bacterium]
ANVTAGVVFVDRQGRINTINRAAEQVLGLDAGEVVGHHYHEVFQGES